MTAFPDSTLRGQFDSGPVVRQPLGDREEGFGAGHVHQRGQAHPRRKLCHGKAHYERCCFAWFLEICSFCAKILKAVSL